MPTQHLTIPNYGEADLTFTTFGSGRPVVLLHGGAGPFSVGGFAQQLAEQKPVQVFMPTHPGFNGTIRPDWLDSIRVLADLYLAWIEQNDWRDVTVIGNSIGGWIAANMAVQGSERISKFVLVDAVGILVEEQPIADFFALSFDQIAQISYYEPARFRRDPATLSEAEQKMMVGNRATLITYAGQPAFADPTLRERLNQIVTPTLVVWGESDGVATPAYGQVFAHAIPHAEFRLLPHTGHMPQLETPDQLLDTIWQFIDS